MCMQASGFFLGVRCATILLHTFGTKLPENTILELTNIGTNYPVLEHLFLLKNILSCFRTFYFVLEHPKNVEKLLKNC